jgi:hypothetical protein
MEDEMSDVNPQRGIDDEDPATLVDQEAGLPEDHDHRPLEVAEGDWAESDPQLDAPDGETD